MSLLEIEYRREIQKAVRDQDFKRAKELRDWGIENHGLDLSDCIVDAHTH